MISLSHNPVWYFAPNEAFPSTLIVLVIPTLYMGESNLEDDSKNN